MAHDVSARLTPADGRRFGVTLGTAFLAVAAIGAWRGHRGLALAAGALAVALGLAALVAPAGLLPVRAGWMRFALVLSRVTTPVVMGALYFLVITPVGLLLRAAGRNPLTRSGSGSTLWVERAPSARRSDLRRQF
jgi:hypothetical protein